VTLTASLCQKEGLTHWRQSEFNLRQIKRRHRKVQKIKHVTPKDDSKREVQQVAVIEAHKIYLLRAERQIDQISRRVIQVRYILHEEKVFSLFEGHTKWISKGKADVP
jgi:IS5 family transposase